MRKYAAWIISTFIYSTTFAQEVLPFKPNEEFEAKIDLTFKKREADDINTFRFEEPSGRKKTTDTPIAFLVINFKVLKVNSEVRVKIIRGLEEKTNKIKIGTLIKLELGFIEDVKSNEKPTKVMLHFINDQKKEVSQVTFEVTTDGIFLVNGEKRGKF
jgi:hypothetical protein